VFSFFFALPAAAATSPKWASQRLNDPASSSIDPVAAFPQRFTSHFSIILLSSDFLHLARKPFRDDTGSVGIPFVTVVLAYPLGIRVAVLTNENDARSVALVVAAVMMFHGS
jgi:hypothetical protein